MMTSDMGRGSAGDSSSLVASLGAGYSRRGFGDTSRTMTDEISGSVASAGAGATPDPAPDPAPPKPARPKPARPKPARPKPARPKPARPKPAPRDRAAARLQRWEIVAVFAVSLGASGLYALVQFIGSLTAQQSLSKQTATLNGSLAPSRPLLDLFLQLLNITLSLAPVLLVFYLLARAGERPSSIGVDARQPGRYGLPLAGPGPGPGRAAGRGDRRQRPCALPDRVPPRRRAERRRREPAGRLVADPCPAALRLPERGPGRDRRRRLPAQQAGQARRPAVPGDRRQRGDQGFLPPVPGGRRFPRQRRHGHHLRRAVPPLGPGDPADHRALPHRLGGLRRLRPAGRPRRLAAQTIRSPRYERARPAMGTGVRQPAAAARLGGGPGRSGRLDRRAEHGVLAAGGQGHHDRARGRARAGLAAVRAAA